MVTANRLLDALSPVARAEILAAARPAKLKQGEILHTSQESSGLVYFLTSGMASYVISGNDGRSAEVGMVGCESLVGSADLLGSYAPIATCLMQVSGTAYRLPVDVMRALFDSSAEVRSLLLQALHCQLLSVSQTAACNRLHSATERLARWLLTAADRSGGAPVQLTQDAVSHLLGTRRTTIALVAAALQRSGIIKYRRGSVEIVEREELAAAACECYPIITRLVGSLYENPFYKG